MFERFSSPARSAVLAAQQEAGALRHGYVGTEHLLLGLCASDGAQAVVLLRGDGEMTAEVIRLAVFARVDSGIESVPGHLPFTPRAKRALMLAGRVSTEMGDFYVGPEHLLLGLLREGEGVAAAVLKDFGWDAAALRDRVLGAVPRGRERGSRFAGDDVGRLEAKIDHLTRLVESLAAQG